MMKHSNLYVYKQGMEERGKPNKKPHLVTVNTFNYSGVWLEPPFIEDDFIHARSVQHLAGWDIVGAVISNDEKQMVQAAADSGFEFIGSYQWWRIGY